MAKNGKSGGKKSFGETTVGGLVQEAGGIGGIIGFAQNVFSGTPDKQRQRQCTREGRKEAKNLGVRFFTVWAFSDDNWKRSKKEIDSLFELYNKSIGKLGKELKKNKIKFRHLGRKDRLPCELVEAIDELEESTKNFEDFSVQLAIDYGGRDEIIRGVNKLLKSGKKSILKKDFDRFLDSCGIPDPDLIIRTSGESRLSGFMPFQSVYSELYFTKLKFPDFGVNELREAIENFGKRKRKFGK